MTIQRKDANASIAIARHFVGIAKKDSAKALSNAGLAAKGGTWAKRCRALPIRDRDHQLSAYRYIVAHAQRGAAVWALTPQSSGGL